METAPAPALPSPLHSHTKIKRRLVLSPKDLRFRSPAAPLVCGRSSALRSNGLPRPGRCARRRGAARGAQRSPACTQRPRFGTGVCSRSSACADHIYRRQPSPPLRDRCAQLALLCLSSPLPQPTALFSASPRPKNPRMGRRHQRPPPPKFPLPPPWVRAPTRDRGPGSHSPRGSAGVASKGLRSRSLWVALPPWEDSEAGRRPRHPEGRGGKAQPGEGPRARRRLGRPRRSARQRTWRAEGAAFLLGFSEASASHPRSFSSDRGWGSRRVRNTPIGPSLVFSQVFISGRTPTGGNSLSPPPFFCARCFSPTDTTHMPHLPTAPVSALRINSWPCPAEVLTVQRLCPRARPAAGGGALPAPTPPRAQRPVSDPQRPPGSWRGRVLCHS